MTQLATETPRLDAGWARIAEIVAQAGAAAGHDARMAWDLTAQAQALLAAQAQAMREPATSLAGPGARPQVELAAWQARRVADHVERNLADTIPVGELAAIARLSKAHFSRAFRGSFGTAPSVFIQRRRVELAKRMMMQTHLPLAEIAYACGLCDQAHFSRLFKRAEGTSPMRWRRARMAAPADTLPSPASRRGEALMAA